MTETGNGHFRGYVHFVTDPVMADGKDRVPDSWLDGSCGRFVLDAPSPWP